MTKKINANEANRIIAEFMGDKKSKYINIATGESREYPNYISLDALVPVWEKLNLPRILEMDITGKGYPVFSFRYFTQHGYSHSAEGKSIQEAAAIATAKAILELKGE